MTKRKLYGLLTAIVVAVVAGGVAFVGCGAPEIAPAPRRINPPAGQIAVTFFVASDTHYGASLSGDQPTIEQLNRTQLKAMNALPGAPWPHGRSKVLQPQAVLALGDLTNHGLVNQWADFATDYGLTAAPGLIRWPVFIVSGNHDRHAILYEPVLNAVRKRHGALNYAWDLGPVRMICLDMYPDADACEFLSAELSAAGPRRPVVLYFHYSITGPYSGGWSDSEKERFALTLAGHNVVGIFHGHFHRSERYTWRGWDVYNTGSPRHRHWSFLAVEITETDMTVASWDWDLGGWSWTHTKPIHAK